MYDVPSVLRPRRHWFAQVWLVSTTLLSGLFLLAWGMLLADRGWTGEHLPDIVLTVLLIIGYGSLVVARGWWFWRRGQGRATWRRLTSLLYWAATLPIGAAAVVSLVYCGC